MMRYGAPVVVVLLVVELERLKCRSGYSHEYTTRSYRATEVARLPSHCPCLDLSIGGPPVRIRCELEELERKSGAKPGSAQS